MQIECFFLIKIKNLFIFFRFDNLPQNNRLAYRGAVRTADNNEILRCRILVNRKGLGLKTCRSFENK